MTRDRIDRLFETTRFSWMTPLPPRKARPGTPEFAAWFGRSCVTSGGKPALVYHGTDMQFDTFSLATSDDEEGGPFFTDNRYIADDYGSRVVEAYVAIENPITLTYEEWGESVERLEKLTGGHDGFMITDFNSGGRDGDVDGESADIGTVYVPFLSAQQIVIVRG